MGRVRDRKTKTKTKRPENLTLALQALSLAAMAILFCCCLSFDIGDWPSPFVSHNNSPALNWCGAIGAVFAYYLLYYIGPGVFVLLIAGFVLMTARFMQLQITQPALRAVGLVLLTIALSATFYLFWPNSLYLFPLGSGGILGVGTVVFLKKEFAIFGTLLILTALWFVGSVLLADTAVIVFMGWLSRILVKAAKIIWPAWAAAAEHSLAVKKIWQRLSARQKQMTPQEALMAAMAERRATQQLESVMQTDIKEIKCDTKPSRADSAGQSKLTPLRGEKKDSLSSQTGYDGYTLPGLELLGEPEFAITELQEKVVKSKATALERLLAEFSINARVVSADTGPVVTMFELELAPGIKVSQISSLANDIARALGVAAVRVVAPLPGKHTIGIEVPNAEKERVRMKDILQLAGTRWQRMHLPLFLGKDSAGEPLVSDLTSMPHLLIAGTTGSGKSVCINSIITSILLTKRPDEVKLILIDPKMVEMTAFNMVPHLMCPIVTETQRAVQILEWATVKMDERFALFSEARVKNITEYNLLGPQEIIERLSPANSDEEAKIPKKLPFIVIVIDELADLMMTAPKEIEAYIVRLAQKSRAIGIHIVLATQRPQATVVTGLIKSNMPTRIGFRVAAKMDSRIILDQNGAEALLGQGDMLFLKPGTSDLIRAQGTFVDEDEVKRIVRHLKQIAEPQFHPELTQLNRIDAANMEKDELFDEAVRIVLDSGRGSVSLLQRRLAVGYARASRMIELMAAMRILGDYKGSQAREVLMTIEEYEQMRQEQQSEEKIESENSSSDDVSEDTDIHASQRAHAATEED